MFLVTLFICALTDIVTYRIKNLILIISATGLLLFDLFISTDSDPISDITAGGIVFLILFPFYLLGLLGAGDVKLLMLSTMYAGLSSMCPVAAASAIASLVIVLSISIVRHEKITKVRYPFAFALLIGAFPLWFNLY